MYLIKNLIKKIFFYLFQKYKIIFNKPGLEFVDTSQLVTFNESYKNFRIYKEGLKRSNNEHTENFLKQNRFLNVIHTAKYILSQNEVFDFAECGCWRGHSSFLIAKSIFESGKKINFHIFDSFEGLSTSTANDGNFHEIINQEKIKIEKQFASSEEFLNKKVLNDFNFCKTYKGWIPSRFHEIDSKKFSFVHIDVDLYEPTIKSLEFFYPRLVPGGIIIFDDYNFNVWQGGKKAWDEYFKGKKNLFFYENPTGGCFLIK